MTEVLGVMLASLALIAGAGGVWAVHYFADHRVYARQLAAERKARRSTAG